MDFNGHIKDGALYCHGAVNVSELVSFLQNRTDVTKLSLYGAEIGNEGAKELANLTNLTTLDLTYNNIGTEGAKALANLTNLTSLNLWNNNIGNEGAKALANLTNLTSLHLSSNNIGDEGAKALANLTNLTSLNLWNNNIGGEGAKALANLTNLTSLDLWNNNIGNEGAKALANLTNLTSLDLWNNNIGGEGAKALSEALKSGKRPNLTLSLEWNKKVVAMPCRGTLKRKPSSEPEVSTASFKKSLIQWFKKPKSNKANNQGAKQQEAQAFNAQFDQQQKSDAQPGPSSKLGKSLTSLDSRRNKKEVTMPRRDTLKRKSSSEPEVSTASSSKSFIQHFKKSKSDEANNQASHQQGTQVQSDQQQKPNALAGLSSKLGKSLTSLDLRSGKRWITMLLRGTLKRKSSSELEVSTTSSNKSLIPRFKKSKSDEANNQASHQQGTQVQSDQQQKPNALAGLSSKLGKSLTSLDLRSGKRWITMLLRGTLKRKSSSELEVSTTSSNKSLIPRFKKSKSDKANNHASQQQEAQIQFDQPGPSGKLDEVLLISRSQSLSSLHSSDSDISRSQFR